MNHLNKTKAQHSKSNTKALATQQQPQIAKKPKESVILTEDMILSIYENDKLQSAKANSTFNTGEAYRIKFYADMPFVVPYNKDKTICLDFATARQYQEHLEKWYYEQNPQIKQPESFLLPSQIKALKLALIKCYDNVYHKPTETLTETVKSEKPSKDTVKPIKSEPEQSIEPKTSEKTVTKSAISEKQQNNFVEMEIRGLNYGTNKEIFTVKNTNIQYWVNPERVPVPLLIENESSEIYKTILQDWLKLLKQYRVKKFQVECWKLRTKLIDENKQVFDVVGSDKVGTFDINEPAIKRCLVSAIKSLLQKQEPKCELAKIEITFNENFTEFFADYNGQPFYDFYII